MLPQLVWSWFHCIIPLLSPAPNVPLLPWSSSTDANAPVLEFTIPHVEKGRVGAQLRLQATPEAFLVEMILPAAMDWSNLWLGIDRQQDQLPNNLSQASLPWLPHHQPWMVGCAQASLQAAPGTAQPATIIQGFGPATRQPRSQPTCLLASQPAAEGVSAAVQRTQLLVPWQGLAIEPGLQQQIAIGLRLDRADGLPLLWGSRSAREWHRDTLVAIGLPSMGQASPMIDMSSTWLWPKQTHVSLRTAWPGSQASHLRYRWQQQSWQSALALQPTVPSQLSIPLPKSLASNQGQSLQLEWLGPAQKPLYQQTIQFESAQKRFERAMALLPATAPQAPWWLKLHRHTVQAIAEQTWQQLLLRLISLPQVASDELLELLAFLEEEQQTTEQSYTQANRRHLLFAGRSSVDGMLIPYTVTLPDVLPSTAPDDSQPSIPILMFLHGRITDDRWFAFVQQSQRIATLTDSNWWIVQPWARGNQYYQQTAEQDVIDTLDDMRQRITLDEDHIYLAGFSMGGAGAWQLSLWRPNLFTAAAILAGGSWLTPKGSRMACNARHLPLIFAHGQADPIIEPKETDIMVEQLRACGLEPTVFSIPDLQHQFPKQTWPQIRAALASHHGKAGAGKAFAYTVQDYTHARHRGIGLARSAHLASLPTISAQLQGNHLVLRCPKQEHATIVMQQLDFPWPPGEPIEVSWNGQPIYYGLPTVLTVGNGSGLR